MTDTPVTAETTTSENAYGRDYPLEDGIPGYAPILWLAYTMFALGVIGIFVGVMMFVGALITFRFELLPYGFTCAFSGFVTFCASFILFAIRDIAQNSFKALNK